MSSRSEHWQHVHATKVIDDVSWWQSPDALWTDLITAHAAPAATVIDVGAGSGMLADALAGLGFTDITVCDISNAALERTRERLGDSVAYLVGDVTSLDAHRTFDVWFDRAVFHFLTDPHDVDGYRASLVRSTHPGSIVIVATFAEDGPEQCSGLDVHRYTPAELANVFVSGGETTGQPEFTLLASERRVHITPWGTAQPFSVVVLARG